MVFKNREGKLPQGDYREYTVDTPGARNRGSRRVVVDQNTGRTYYTDDHYRNFTQIDKKRKLAKMQTSNLKKVSWECVHFTADNLIVSMRKDIEDCGFRFFMIDNESIYNDQGLLEALATSMELPDYFGHNWDALDECLTDLGWLPQSKGYILLIQNSKKLWNNTPFSLGKLIQSWLSAAEEWRKSNVPFHLFFAEME